MSNKYIINKDYAELVITSNKFGVINFKIDLDDLEKIKLSNWCIHAKKDPHETYYYATESKKKLLHRVIIDAPKGMYVDHINRDTTDNRKENLRLCTPQENARNRKLNVTNTSGHTGVYWSKQYMQWLAYIVVDYKHIPLGKFNKIEDAIQVRKDAEVKYFKDYKPHR